MTRAHVCVMTPTYGGTVTTAYLDSMIRHMQNPTHITSYRYLAGDSLITRARNNMLQAFREQADEFGWTHLLWQDGDVSLSGDGIERMLSRQVDTVAAPVPMKIGRSRHGWAQSVVGLIDEVEPMFYRAKYAATGCLMWSRKAVDAIVEHAVDNDNIYEDGGLRHDVFRVGHDGAGFYESEDWYVCRIMRELGFDLYVDSSFAVSHVDGPRVSWDRPAMPIAETILVRDYAGALPSEIVNERWTTNDFDRLVIMAAR